MKSDGCWGWSYASSVQKFTRPRSWHNWTGGNICSHWGDYEYFFFQDLTPFGLVERYQYFGRIRSLIVLHSSTPKMEETKSTVFWNITLCLPSAFTLVSCSAYFSTLKMEALCSPETSVDFQRTTRRYIPEDSTLHNHRCENLTSMEETVSSWNMAQVLPDYTVSHPTKQQSSSLDGIQMNAS
jgi:hypothetical protein